MAGLQVYGQSKELVWTLSTGPHFTTDLEILRMMLKGKLFYVYHTDDISGE